MLLSTVRKVYRHGYRVIAYHGFRGALRLLIEKATTPPAVEAPSPFDIQHGVHTDGREDLSELTITDSRHALHGHRPQPTPADHGHVILRALPPPIEGSVFMDVGAGRGRMLLVASEYPFRRIVGVEFASELAEAARRNIAAYRSDTQRCRAIEVQHADATRVELPLEPLVLYLYNPFTEIVMRRFVQHVAESLRAHPRLCTVVYRVPECASVWDAEPLFTVVGRAPLFTIWRHVPGQ